MTNKTLLLLLFTSILQISCSNSIKSDLQTVSKVDLDRYQGTWYEIAKYENSFQKDCLATRAKYKINENNSVNVINECKNVDGGLNRAEGTALVEDQKSNAKLKVSFVPFLQRFGIFSGDYWIIELDPEYRYAVVGHPERTYLWILSRSPIMDEETLEELKIKITEHHKYSLDKLITTPTWYDQ